jgi:hypothetical protein
MTAERVYTTAASFRQALEARLFRLAEAEGVDLMRLRRQVAFDRLLARVLSDDDDDWTLKGGYALELRSRTARTTRDIDLTLRSPAALPAAAELSTRLRTELQARASHDARDFFEFLVGQVTLDIDAAPYGGARFPVDARLAGRSFVKFHVDIGVGDELLEPVDRIEGRDWLDFAGIAAPVIPCISKEQQFAEKLHAYTAPSRERPNSRVKDLVDMALLILRFDLDVERLRQAAVVTFSRRDSHNVPEVLTHPPADWGRPFAALAEETDLKMDVAQAFATLEQFHRQWRG